MADYERDLLPFPSSFLSTALPGLHEHVVLDRSAPSAVRVLGKSMHVLAAGWMLSIGWLWIETLRQHIRRHDVPPPGYALETMVGGLIPALVMALIGWAFARFTGKAPYRDVDRREWWHAFWWSFVPNALLLVTIWVMLQDAR